MAGTNHSAGRPTWSATGISTWDLQKTATRLGDRFMQERCRGDRTGLALLSWLSGDDQISVLAGCTSVARTAGWGGPLWGRGTTWSRFIRTDGWSGRSGIVQRREDQESNGQRMGIVGAVCFSFVEDSGRESGQMKTKKRVSDPLPEEQPGEQRGSNYSQREGKDQDYESQNSKTGPLARHSRFVSRRTSGVQMAPDGYGGDEDLSQSGIDLR